MPRALQLRPLSPEEQAALEQWAHSRTASARLVERARIIRMASQGHRVPAIAQQLQLTAIPVRTWCQRFNAAGLAGLADTPRAGRPATYSAHKVAEVMATALTPPEQLGLPCASWTLDRLEAYLNDQTAIAIKRSRIDDLLIAEGLRWRTQEPWVGERVDPQFAHKRGALKHSTRAPLRGVS
jgi:transposase